MPYSITDSVLGVLVICGIAGAAALVLDVVMELGMSFERWRERRR